jgi:hypothetical protein
MPIRFRCVYCEQLLGIARRKAGTVVKCPNCGGQLIVPPPEEDDDADDRTTDAADMDYAPEPKIQAVSKPAATARHQSQRVATKDSPGGEGAFLFERSDFDELLKPAVEHKPGLAGHVPPSQKSQPHTIKDRIVDLAEIEALPTVSSSVGEALQPAPMPNQPLIQPATQPAPKVKGIVLSRMKVTLLLIVFALLLGGAFGGGILFAMKVLHKS